MLQFLYNISGQPGRVLGLCVLLIVSAVSITIVLTGPVALVYLWQHHAPLVAKVVIGSGSTLVTTLLGWLFGTLRRKRRANALSARLLNDDHAAPGGSAPGA